MSSDTIFIRHKLRTNKEILETLWRENLIAVHYLDSESTDPAYYREMGEKTAAEVLDRLHSCVATGAVVAASFRDIRPGMLKLGRIVHGKSSMVARPFQDINRGKLIYKVVNLVSAKDIDLRRYPVLNAIQPRQKTLTGWPSVAPLLEAILDNRPLPIALSSLHPSQMEVLCYEYLRVNRFLSHLILPIGRNMYEVDICALSTDGKMVFAQVTNTDNESATRDKVYRLDAFTGDNCHLFYFGPRNANIQNCRVTFLPIEEVFDFMLNDNRLLIEKMINTDWANNWL
ncbi:MAG: hypothetical protein A4E72_01700 [Syntrophus sp. PtaU1.Bin208]|nr:MAG: hypothetical protein A4E72_01700 [Syntrophus sp. PtaU1.Bin208]